MDGRTGHSFVRVFADPTVRAWSVGAICHPGGTPALGSHSRSPHQTYVETQPMSCQRRNTHRSIAPPIKDEPDSRHQDPRLRPLLPPARIGALLEEVADDLFVLAVVVRVRSLGLAEPVARKHQPSVTWPGTQPSLTIEMDLLVLERLDLCRLLVRHPAHRLLLALGVSDFLL